MPMFPAEPTAECSTNGNPVFGLYEQDETGITDPTPLAIIPEDERFEAGTDDPMLRSPAQCQQSLRSVSLSHGPQASSSSPPLQNGSSIGNIANIDSTSQNMLQEAKRSKKNVSDYYKKQNELLENFKSDSEQIQVFQKTRTRQRLESTSSQNGPLESGPCSVANPVEEPKAPLLAHVDDDVDVIVKGSGYLSPNNNCQEKDNISHESLLIRHEIAADKAKDESKSASRFAMITLLVNVSLMMAKAVASYLSGSLSIISSLVDSLVDITSGLVIWVCSRMIRKRDPYLYPRGRTRLEPLSLIIISVVMGVASVQLIVDAFKRIYAAYIFDTTGEGERPALEMSWPTVGIMIATVIIKGTLFFICQRYNDPSIEVLAMDHRNDCISNTVALGCAWAAQRFWYYLDPIGAVLVSIYILYTWTNTGYEHLTKLCGKSASPEFINRIIKVCIDHDQRITHLDTVYVYHYGTKFLVEVHIVLDENMSLKVAHDISESLQINIESLPDVERAFVHPDYEYDHQPEDEHKVV